VPRLLPSVCVGTYVHLEDAYAEGEGLLASPRPRLRAQPAQDLPTSSAALQQGLHGGVCPPASAPSPHLQAIGRGPQPLECRSQTLVQSLLCAPFQRNSRIASSEHIPALVEFASSAEVVN